MNSGIIFRWKTDIHCPGNGDLVKDVGVECFGISNFTSIPQKEKCCTEELQRILWNNVLKSPYRTELITTDKCSLNKDTSNVGSHDDLTNLTDTAFAERENDVLSVECTSAKTKLCKNVLLDMTKYTEELQKLEESAGKVTNNIKGLLTVREVCIVNYYMT